MLILMLPGTAAKHDITLWPNGKGIINDLYEFPFCRFILHYNSRENGTTKLVSSLFQLVFCFCTRNSSFLHQTEIRIGRVYHLAKQKIYGLNTQQLAEQNCRLTRSFLCKKSTDQSNAFEVWTRLNKQEKNSSHFV